MPRETGRWVDYSAKTSKRGSWFWAAVLEAFLGVVWSPLQDPEQYNPKPETSAVGSGVGGGRGRRRCLLIWSLEVLPP